MDEKYQLFYRDIEIGEVVQTASDFPNEFGTFSAIEGTGDEAVRKHIQRLIEHSISQDQLMQGDRWDEWYHLVTVEEIIFKDLIVTDDWSLRDETKVWPIFVPNFCQNNLINWRLNTQVL